MVCEVKISKSSKKNGVNCDMITYLKGNLTYVSESMIIVEVAGVGYELRVTSSVMNDLPAINDNIKVYTFMSVKEDGVSLFGFNSFEELDIFKMLIKVSGIGPKGAIAILSFMTLDELRFAILSDDAKAIAKTPGVGAKTAGKLILELKDKMKLQDSFDTDTNDYESKTEVMDKGVRNDAIQALIALGYSSSDSYKAVRAVKITEDMDVEIVLKMALKNIGL